MRRPILDRQSFLKEALWKGVIDRSKNDRVREEDAMGHHKFTDNNGVHHNHGVLPENRNELVEFIVQITLKHLDDEKIDLNDIDTSKLKSIAYVFQKVFSDLNYAHSIRKPKLDSLVFDTSGWDISNVDALEFAFYDVNHDIGADNWKVSPDMSMEYGDFKFSPYYQDHLPKWYKFDIEDWATSNTKSREAVEWGDDDERTKELGYKCYWVKYYDHCSFYDIPDNVRILDIDGSKFDTPSPTVDIENLKTLKNFPKSFNPKSNILLKINLDKFEDDHFDVPKGIKYLHPKETNDIKKLPTIIDCGIMLSPKQLGHIIEVKGDVQLRSGVTSLSGIPKKIGGDLTIHNGLITDLTGCPSKIGGTLELYGCEQLKTLKGAPNEVGGSVMIKVTKPINFEYLPKIIGNDEIIITSYSGENFMGLPEEIGTLSLKWCRINSLEGLPKHIDSLTIEQVRLNGEEVRTKDVLAVSPEIDKRNIDIRN